MTLATGARLAGLVTGVRAAVTRRTGWRETASLVADELGRALPSPDVLTPEQLAGDPDTYVCHILHVEPDGSFSIVAMVWLPGQVTPIHDHLTWCVFAVLQGVEREERFALRDGHLVPAGVAENHVGQVSGFAPPGDIHRVRNAGPDTAVSLHVYGTDLSRVGSSVRRLYDLPVLDQRPGRGAFQLAQKEPPRSGGSAVHRPCPLPTLPERRAEFTRYSSGRWPR